MVQSSRRAATTSRWASSRIGCFAPAARDSARRGSACAGPGRAPAHPRPGSRRAEPRGHRLGGGRRLLAGRSARVDLDELLEEGIELRVAIRPLRRSGQREQEGAEREGAKMVMAGQATVLAAGTRLAAQPARARGLNLRVDLAHEDLVPPDPCSPPRSRRRWRGVLRDDYDSRAMERGARMTKRMGRIERSLVFDRT